MSRQPQVIGNWKMNLSPAEAEALCVDFLNQNLSDSVKTGLAVPAIYLASCAKIDQLNIGSQNCSTHNSGAYTGDISAQMIAQSGGRFTLVGHSERREIFGETNENLVLKMKQAFANQLEVVFCLGEPLEVRENGAVENYLSQQLSVLRHFADKDERSLTLAYEPIWAIGTGKTATPEMAQETHAFIRAELSKIFGGSSADKMAILYGGSVKPDNAKSLFDQPDIDGGLIGGASLKVESFVKIIESAG